MLKISFSEMSVHRICTIEHFFKSFSAALKLLLKHSVLSLLLVEGGNNGNSLFVIINTIKLSVFSRRSEISIMRYVGATGWFITLPFLFEGIIIGLVASGFAFLVETLCYHYVETLVLTDLQMITLASYATIQMPLLWGFLAVGVLCGIIGSSISLGKYLRV